LKRVERDACFILVIEERMRLPLIRPGLCGCRDNGARRLLIFRFEVLRDNAEFAHRVARERTAPAGILTRHATREDVVLVTGTVDKNVDLFGALRAG
jgi:hypothetical protein